MSGRTSCEQDPYGLYIPWGPEHSTPATHGTDQHITITSPVPPCTQPQPVMCLNPIAKRNVIDLGGVTGL